MKIIVAGTPQARSEEIAELLSGADGEGPEIESLGTEFNAEDLSRRLQTEKDLAAVLLYALPEYVAEAAVARDGDVDEALAAWRRAAEGILSVREKAESRTVVLNGQSVTESPETIVPLVSERLGLALAVREDAGGMVASQQRNEHAPLQAILAAESVQASVELANAARSLEAATIPVSDEPIEFTTDWRAAQKAYQQLIEQKDLRERQLSQVQEALERYYLEAKELRDDCGGGSSDDVDELAAYALQLERQYMRLLHSRSWKLLAPIREGGRLVKGILRRKRVPRNRLPRRPRLLQKTS